MKRKELIQKAREKYVARINGNNTSGELLPKLSDSFLEGAVWADNNPMLPWMSFDKHPPKPDHEGSKFFRRYVFHVKGKNPYKPKFFVGYFFQRPSYNAWVDENENIVCINDDVDYYFPLPALPVGKNEWENISYYDETETPNASELAERLQHAVAECGDRPIFNSTVMPVPGGDAFSMITYRRGDDHFELE